MKEDRNRLLLAFFVAFATSCAAYANETVSYSYDANGRLLSVTRTGTINNGVSAAYSLDKADNRANFTLTGSPNSPPPPPPQNHPPVAVADNLGAQLRCVSFQANLTSNDSDPDGDAISIVAASSPNVSVSIVSVSSVSIGGGPTPGTRTLNYTIRDPSGATASSTATWTAISGGPNC